MRINENTKKMEVVCNCCGRKLTASKGVVKEGVLSINADWGYFSKKDGEIHKIDICEECYDKWKLSFKIPIDIVSKNEML